MLDPETCLETTCYSIFYVFSTGSDFDCFKKSRVDSGFPRNNRGIIISFIYCSTAEEECQGSMRWVHCIFFFFEKKSSIREHQGAKITAPISFLSALYSLNRESVKRSCMLSSGVSSNPHFFAAEKLCHFQCKKSSKNII